ncbi:MAG: hypothetical protein ABI947_28965 [Chloroflexota bacterium]
MWKALPLAHGALGIWDELVPIVLIGSFGIFLIISAWISRRNENNQSDEPTPPPDNASPTESPDSATDHYRLD